MVGVSVGGAEGLALPNEAPEDILENLPGLVIDLPGRIRMLAHERRAEFHTRQVDRPGMPDIQNQHERHLAEHHIWELNDNFPHSKLIQPLL